MLSQHKLLNTSGSWSSVKATIKVGGLRQPQNVSINNGHIVGSYVIGRGERWIREYNWQELPHVELANLRAFNEQGKLVTKPQVRYRTVFTNKRGKLITGPQARSRLRIDPKPLERFVRTFGVFSPGKGSREFDSREFDLDITDVATRQEVLRNAWLIGEELRKDRDPRIPNLAIIDNEELEEILGVYRLDFNVSFFPERNYEEIEMTTDNLWTLICYLFLRHFAANKTGVCGNPDCISPYFLKRRRDQRFCELGPCTQYAQREYTRKWWHLKGKTRRAEKLGKSPRRKRQ